MRVDCVRTNNHVHSAPQEHIERERKDSEHRKNTQNIHVHNITTIHKPHGLEELKWWCNKNLESCIKNLSGIKKSTCVYKYVEHYRGKGSTPQSLG